MTSNEYYILNKEIIDNYFKLQYQELKDKRKISIGKYYKTKEDEEDVCFYVLDENHFVIWVSESEIKESSVVSTFLNSSEEITKSEFEEFFNKTLNTLKSDCLIV